MASKPNARSDAAREYRHWYWTSRWRATSRMQLRDEPLCRFCTKAGRVTPATVCDHVIDHKGNADLFWNGERQSLCATCHNQAKRTGRIEIGLDGWPVEA
jgi:hypothetical protein